MSSIHLQDYIERNLISWSECQGTVEASLLRLTLLRKFYQDLHSEKSRCLAMGMKTEATLISDWENRLDEMRVLPNLNSDFETLFMKCGKKVVTPSTLPRKTKGLAEGFLKSLEKHGMQREKFLRMDREWEQSIAVEAFTAKWNFWFLESWVMVNLIEEWDRSLHERLWPRGVVLFAEAGSPPDPQCADEVSHQSWLGRWVIVLHPHYQGPLDIPVRIDDLPGYDIAATQPQHWKLVHSTQHRGTSL